jgi:N-acetylneuraminate synthase
MDATAARELITGSALIQQMRGGVKEPAKEEQVTIDFAFATVVSIKDIKKGDIFSMDNLWVKRPGTGEIFAEHFNSLLGRQATRDIQKDDHIKKTDFV